MRGGGGEEGAGEGGYLVLLKGDIEGALGQLGAGGVEGGDHEVDGALGALIGEGVEVELFLAGGDIELQVLLAVDGAIAGGGIEGTGTTGIVEAHLGDSGGDVIGDDEAAEGDDAVEGQREGQGFLANGDHL